MSLWSRALRGLRSLSSIQLQPSQSAPVTPASQTAMYERLLVSERTAYDAKVEVFGAQMGRLEAERTASEAVLKEEAQRKVFAAEKGRLEAEKGRLEAEHQLQAVRTEGMSLKGRLHARGVQEEAEDYLRRKHGKWDMSRTQLYEELASQASQDQLVACMKAGAAAAKQDTGEFAAAMYKRLSESAHKTNRTSGLLGRPIVILLDGVLTATECEVLGCMAKYLKIPYVYKCLGDNLDLTPGIVEGASSKE